MKHGSGIQNKEQQLYYPSVPDFYLFIFWKIKFEEFAKLDLQKSISKWIFAGYTGSANSVWNRLKIQFVELDLSNLIFQKSITNGKGVWAGIILLFFLIIKGANKKNWVSLFWTLE